VSKIAVVSLLCACMFVSAAETYFCMDCGPGGTLSALSEGASRGSHSREILSSDQGAFGQRHHSPLTCPVCLSPLLVVGDQVPMFLTSTNAVPQDVPRLLSGTAGTIYKPPRIAS
jgi:hypothetical protein